MPLGVLLPLHVLLDELCFLAEFPNDLRQGLWIYPALNQRDAY